MYKRKNTAIVLSPSAMTCANENQMGAVTKADGNTKKTRDSAMESQQNVQESPSE